MTGAEQWIGSAAIIGVLAAFWSRVKTLSWRVVNLFIARARLEGSVSNAVIYYCWSEMKHSPFGEKRYDSVIDFIQLKGHYQTIGFEIVGYDSMFFWKGWKFLTLGLSTRALEGGGNTGLSITLTFIRGTFDLDKLLIEALDKYNERTHKDNGKNRYCVKRLFGKGSQHNKYWTGEDNKAVKSPSEVNRSAGDENIQRRYLKWKAEQIGMIRNIESDPFDFFVFPPKVLEVVERCKRWLNSENWYKKREIPWRLGILASGQPGCGKTSFVKSIGNLLDLPIMSYDLASFGNQDFEKAWENMLTQSPCIALLEDVDAVFDGRINRLGEEGGGLTFDCLLNCIGGVKDSSGVLVFVTTNKPECLDEALGKMDHRGMSTRPGRIDIVLELSTLDEECRLKIAKRILSDCPHFIEEMVNLGNNTTGAQFTEMCAKVALEHYWSDKGPKVDTNGVCSKYYKSKPPSWINPDTYEETFAQMNSYKGEKVNGSN